MTDEGACEACARGYYKDNGEGVSAMFGQCQICFEHLITAGTGSTSGFNCTQGEQDENVRCSVCPGVTLALWW